MGRGDGLTRTADRCQQRRKRAWYVGSAVLGKTSPAAGSCAGMMAYLLRRPCLVGATTGFINLKKENLMQKFYRAVKLTAALAKAAFWVDRLWQQLQRHVVFTLQADPI